VHEKVMEIRWRDMDAFGHVNNSVFLTFLEEVRDEWLERAVLPVGGDTWSFVLARVAIDFRSELTQADDVVVARCGLVRLGSGSVTTREEILTRDGRLAAESESVLVAFDQEARTSRTITAAERAGFEAVA
jgi:acyl-CoA thioester hydrolase